MSLTGAVGQAAPAFALHLIALSPESQAQCAQDLVGPALVTDDSRTLRSGDHAFAEAWRDPHQEG